MKLGPRGNYHEGWAAFNQEKALVGAFPVITSLRMDLFEALSAIVLC